MKHFHNRFLRQAQLPLCKTHVSGEAESIKDAPKLCPKNFAHPQGISLIFQAIDSPSQQIGVLSSARRAIRSTFLYDWVVRGIMIHCVCLESQCEVARLNLGEKPAVLSLRTLIHDSWPRSVINIVPTF
ncbi:hypothetical protein Ancab_008977 [Ancistrocladus abbreviatus]